MAGAGRPGRVAENPPNLLYYGDNLEVLLTCRLSSNQSSLENDAGGTG